jgi:hypothetical protein
MDSESEVAVGDDQIASLEAVFAGLLEGPLDGRATIRSLQHLFNQ